MGSEGHCDRGSPRLTPTTPAGVGGGGALELYLCLWVLLSRLTEESRRGPTPRIAHGRRKQLGSVSGRSDAWHRPRPEFGRLTVRVLLRLCRDSAETLPRLTAASRVVSYPTLLLALSSVETSLSIPCLLLPLPPGPPIETSTSSKRHSRNGRDDDACFASFFVWARAWLSPCSSC